MWSFFIPEDTQRGYRYPSSAGFPSYNIFPGESQFGRRLGGRDSIKVYVTGAEIPRVLDLQYANQTYPSAADSVRTLWLKDTVLALSGPASVDSLVLPEAIAAGRPILFAGEAGALNPGPSGKEGAKSWLNAQASAKRFLPAFAGQNTAKRSPSRVTGFSADSTIEFSQVTLAGRTYWRGSLEGTPGKRLRILNKGGAPLIVGDSTTAQVAGSMALGLAKVGVETPIRADSLAWWSGGIVRGRVIDSAATYWYKGPAEKVFSAAMVERLGVGRGRDTVGLAAGHRLITHSEKGFHLDMDTAYMPTQDDFPRLGLFQRGLSASWPGRLAGDSVTAELRKTHPSQRPFRRDGSGYQAVPALREDSQAVSVYLPIDQAGQSYFLAREFAVAAGLTAAVGVGKDTLFGVRASRPGDVRLDTAMEISGLSLDSMRVLLKRRITLDNLLLEGSFTLKASGKAPIHQPQPKAFALRAGRWDSVAVTYAAGDYRFALQAGDSAVVALERIPPGLDTSLLKPVSGPTVENREGALRLKPVLTPAELARTRAYLVEVSSVDPSGKVSLKLLEGLPPDSTVRVPVMSGTAYTVRIGYESTAGRIYWVEQPIAAGVADGFRQALNDLAPTYTGRVRELVGVAEDVDLKTLLADFSTEEAGKVELDEWQGAWKALGPQTRLRRGKGYLLALPKDMQPTATANLTVRPAPDTLKLDTGWNLIANPRPYSVAAAAVALEASSVSKFYALTWSGVGKTATWTWTVSDTLRPFTGYAVHASRNSELIFDSRPQAAPKRARTDIDEISLSIRKGKEVLAQLVLQPTLHRPSAPLPLLGPRTWALWRDSRGLLNRVPPSLTRFEEAFEVHSVGTEELVLEFAGLQPEAGMALAFWDPVHGRLTTLKGPLTLKTAAGVNSYTLLALPVSEVAAKEAALRAANPLALQLAVPAPNPARRYARLRLSIPAGQGNAIRLEAAGLDGRRQYTRTWRTLTPGFHEVGLDLSTWAPGTYFLRLEARGPKGRGTHAVKLLVLEGAP